jgi:hypothetical protein
VVVVLGALLAIALLAVAWLARRTSRLQQRLDSITRGADGGSLEAVLDHHLESVFQVSQAVEDLRGRTRVLEREGRFAVQRVGLIRFNPFEDTGGNQSFALALLDANADGFLVSSLHSRNGTRIYAKVVTAGRSDAALSDEETDALRAATADRPAPARRST